MSPAASENGEEAGTDHEDALAPEEVGEAAAGDDQHAEHQGVTVDDPLGRGQRGVEVTLDLGDRDAQRGEVVGDHEHAQRHRHEGELGAPVDLPGCTGHARLPVLVREPRSQSGRLAVMDSESDASIVAASLAAPEAFGALFDRHARTLFRYLVRRIGPDEADSLLGEVFRIAFEKRSTYDLERENARPWLYGIATNLVAKHHRSEARRIRASARLVAQRSPQEDPGDRIVAAIDAADLWPRVADAVTALPEGERDALLLFVWEELGYDEIAAALGVPVGTVRSRLNRARMRMRELDHATGGEG